MRDTGKMENSMAKGNLPTLKVNPESEYGRMGNVRSGYRVL